MANKEKNKGEGDNGTSEKKAVGKKRPQKSEKKANDYTLMRQAEVGKE